MNELRTETTTYMTASMIIKLIEKVRCERLLSYKDLSVDTGVSYATIINNSKGKTPMSLKTLRKYIKFLNDNGYKIVFKYEDNK